MSNQNYNAEDSEAIGFLREMVRARPGGENRPQQEQAVLAIEDALQNKHHLLVQAGTGTGKSFATLIPAILSGERVVYSTATKQLSEQLVNIDIPTLRKEAIRQGDRAFSAVLLKGRENYLCKKKHNELTTSPDDADEKPAEDDGLFSFEEVAEDNVIDSMDGTHHAPQGSELVMSAEELAEQRERNRKPTASQMKEQYDKMFAWARRTKTGDRSEAPAMHDDVWKGVSVTNNECVGRKSCPFGEECFSEGARAEAKKAQVVVTNHAVTSIDLESEEGMLGPRSVFIFDEIHELDNFVSSAWGTVITEKILLDALKVAKRFKPSPMLAERWDKLIEETGLNINDLNRAMLKMEDGLIWPDNAPGHIEETLRNVLFNFMSITELASTSADEGEKEQIRRTVGSMTEAIELFLDDDPENVRWCKNESMKKEDDYTRNLRMRSKKKIDPKPPSLNCAPMRIGPRLMQALEDKNATMIGTSATITVGGKFDIPLHDFGLDASDTNGKQLYRSEALDVGTPFDYSKQAMFYVPNPEEFPSAEYKNKEAHSAAVEEETLELVKAMGGRGLILTTTTKRINEIADYLDDNLDEGIKVLRQGDMPAPQLIDEFVRDETSVLVATMGMWHGLNAEGPTCMLVVMDKIPFPTMDDPLASARQKYADQNGRSGFMDVYVASANVKIAQGAGRLIRTMTDRGVIAMFDTRIVTKRYGRAMMKSLPNSLRVFNDRDVVLGAAKRLREAREKEIDGS